MFAFSRLRSCAARIMVAALFAPLTGCDGSNTSGGTTTITTPTAAVGPLGEREDLPVDERIDIENLSAPVDVVRDKWGRPHIFASSVADAMRAQGYLVAKDRTLQLE